MDKAALPLSAESAINQASLQAALVLGCRPAREAMAERAAGVAGNGKLLAAAPSASGKLKTTETDSSAPEPEPQKDRMGVERQKQESNQPKPSLNTAPANRSLV